MKIVIGTLLLLVSCREKVAQVPTTLNDESVKDIKWGEIAPPDPRLLGEWMIQLSCDESFVCNQCPHVLFRDNGMGVTTYSSEWPKDNFRWEVKNDSVKLVTTYESYFADGEYSLTFKIEGDRVKLTLLDSKQGKCYQLNGAKR
jgi:hypothetical protein